MSVLVLLHSSDNTSRKTAIYDYVYDCVFSRVGQVSAYMTGGPCSYCGPVIWDIVVIWDIKVISHPFP